MVLRVITFLLSEVDLHNAQLQACICPQTSLVSFKLCYKSLPTVSCVYGTVVNKQYPRS